MVVLGNVVSLLGVILVLIGVVAAALKVGAERGMGFGKADDTVAKILAALPKVIDALAKAPTWLACVLVGVFLVWFGRQLATGGYPFT